MSVMGDKTNVLFDGSPMAPKNLEEAVYQSIGAASMCWETTPAGVFDSDLARQLAQELLEYLIAGGIQ